MAEARPAPGLFSALAGPPVIEKPAEAPAPRNLYVPDRCQRAPNSALDRAFGLYICNQRDTRCRFHGPVFIQDQTGRHYECRAREPS